MSQNLGPEDEEHQTGGRKTTLDEAIARIADHEVFVNGSPGKSTSFADRAGSAY